MSDAVVADAPAAAPEASAPATEAPVAAPAAPAAPPAPREPSAAEARKAYLEQKLEDLRAKKATRSAQTDYEAKLKAIEEQRAQLEADREAWAAAKKNPIQALKQLGIAPEDLYNRLTDELLDSNTPEAQQRQMVESLRKEIEAAKRPPELESALAELKALKEELEGIKGFEKRKQEHLLKAEREARESEMYGILSQGDFADLHDYYDRDQLMAAAYQVSTMLYEAKQPYDYHTVAKTMLNLHNQWWDSVSSRKAAKQKPPVDIEKSETQPQPGPSEKKETANIGNAVASAVGSSGERKLDPKAATARRVKMIEQMLQKP